MDCVFSLGPQIFLSSEWIGWLLSNYNSSTMKTLISLAQISIMIGKPEVNLAKAESYINEAVKNKSQIILLPELWTSGYDLDRCDRYVDINLSILDHLQNIANLQRIAIGGSYILKFNQSYVNSFILIQPDMIKPALYNKVHLFRLLHEEQHFQPGDVLGIANFDWGTAGLTICYDLRFPELFRAYRLQNVSCIFLVAQWGIKRTVHWQTLLKARAIENQYFLAAVDGVGPIHDNYLAGFSAVISPWGDTLVEANAKEEILLTTELDLSLIEDSHNRLPSLEDYRGDLYSNWYS